MLAQAGFDSLVYEDPYGILADLVQDIGSNDPNSQAQNTARLLETFQSVEGSEGEE